MTSINLRELLAPWGLFDIPSCQLKDITLDSRTVTQNDLFIAIPGQQTDGRLYISQAIKRGAAAIIVEENNIWKNNHYKINNVPIIFLKKLQENVSLLAGRFYHHPSSKLCLIGVTGTNGKTTVTHLLAQWVKILGCKSATMGTIGNGIINHISSTNNTTDSPIEIQKFLAELKRQYIDFVSIEVSSHGLVQNRVNGLHFAGAIFTNLTHDHLDYHKNITQYEKAKWKLFNELDVKQYVINIDDHVGKNWLKKLSNKNTISVSCNSSTYTGKNYWLCLDKVYYYCHGTKIYFRSSWGNGEIYIQLIGIFNVYNVLLVLAMMLGLGYTIDQLCNTANQLHVIPGRMEKFHTGDGPTVFIDYAHTPDALEKSLQSVKLYCHGQLWCIFGCGGDRDKSKRSLMGAIAKKYSDYIILTTDNPRDEPVQDIINDIKNGIQYSKNVREILDREAAILYALEYATSLDCILIAGKGHENYQIINKQKFLYSDRNTVIKLLGI